MKQHLLLLIILLITGLSGFSDTAMAQDPVADRLWVEPLKSSTVRICLSIKNAGDMPVASDAPVALYAVNPPSDLPADIIEVKRIGNVIAPREAADMFFDIEISTLTEQMSVRIGDDGSGFPVAGFVDTDFTNNTIALSAYTQGFDDFYGTPMNTGIPDMHVLGNDRVEVDQEWVVMTTILSATASKEGTVSVAPDNKINYTPPPGFTGVEEISYWSTGLSSKGVPLMVSAKAYIYVFPVSQTTCAGSGVHIGIEDTNKGVTVDWYDSATEGALQNDQEGNDRIIPLFAEVTFKASDEKIAAFNNRLPVDFEIMATPLPTFTALSPVEICSGNMIGLEYSIANISTGATIHYYSDANGEYELPSSVVQPFVTTTYYAQAVNSITSCRSAIVPIQVTVNPAPVLKMYPIALCSSTEIDLNDYIQSATVGSTVLFYSDAEATQELPSTIVEPSMIDIVYYARAYSVNGCVSSVVPISITVGLGPVFSPPEYQVCGATTLDLQTILSDMPSFCEVHFYSDDEASQELQSSIVLLESDITYYMRAHDTNLNCWGPIVSTKFTVATPPTFDVTHPAAILPGSSVELANTISGENLSNIELHYYSDAAATTELPASIVTPTVTTTYYVRALDSNTGCWSLTKPVKVTVKSPAPPEPVEFTITIPTVEGIMTDPAPGQHTIESGSWMTLKITALPDYDITGMVVRINGKVIDPRQALRADAVTDNYNDTPAPLTFTYELGYVFKDLTIEIDGVRSDPVGNADIRDTQIDIAVDNGQLVIDNGKSQPVTVSVYTLNGKLYTLREIPAASTTHLALPQSVYIVRAGAGTWKVVID